MLFVQVPQSEKVLNKLDLPFFPLLRKREKTKWFVYTMINTTGNIMEDFGFALSANTLREAVDKITGKCKFIQTPTSLIKFRYSSNNIIRNIFKLNTFT